VSKDLKADVAAARKNWQTLAIMRTAWASSLKPLGACLLAVMLCAGLAQPAHAITANTSVIPSAVTVTKETAYRGVFEGGAEARTGLFAADNPVNRIDPSGHDDLIDVLATSYIQSTLVSMAMPVITKAGGYALASLIPQPLIQDLETLPVSAYEVGGSLNVQGFGGKIPAGLSASAGAEALWSPRTHNWAAYGYWGAGVTLGNTTENASLQGNLGLVFGTPTSSDYTEWFETLSVPYNALPAPLIKRIDGLIASATLPSDVLQSVAKYGIPTPSSLNKLTVNVFKSPGGSSCGINFSYELLSREKNASSNVGYSWSYYVQAYPDNNVQF
jgi:hypothetical protein